MLHLVIETAPHKIVVAASALANATQLFDRNDLNGDAVVISLGNILSEIEANGRLYPFNSLDDQLLESAVATFVEISQELENSPLSGEIDKLSERSESLTWEEWLTEFKKEAGAINPQLKVDEKGMSLIDFMEHEQLQRAYRDGVNPKSVAADFADQFDITKFGQ